MLLFRKPYIVVRVPYTRSKMRDTEKSELHEGSGRTGGAAPKLSEKEKALAEEVKKLRELLKPGDTVYTVLRHVSRSGMTRVIDLYVFKDNEPLRLSWSAAEVLGWGYDTKYEGVKVGGCGMDMGFHLVYSLSSALYRGVGYDCLGDRCPAADHVNIRDKSQIPKRHYDGYALRQRWL